MKIHCPCGAVISDSTDGLPRKGHLIPDQEWVPLCTTVEKVIADAASGRVALEAAFTQVHLILGDARRLVYQCRDCGRLFINDRQHQTHQYTTASDEACKEILRSRDEAV